LECRISNIYRAIRKNAGMRKTQEYDCVENYSIRKQRNRAFELFGMQEWKM